MILRNKKTGEIGEVAGVMRFTVYEPNMQLCGNSVLGQYDTLAELNAEWEDCTPKEPLIKDEKIRKAVRVWAEANHVTRVKYDASWNSFRCTDFVIGFDYDFDRHDGLEDEESYTIAELCGEEEE